MTEDNNWSFGEEAAPECPVCATLLSGLNWIETDGAATGMALVPCGHELDTAVWELSFKGRKRLMGTSLRLPYFKQKNGS